MDHTPPRKNPSKTASQSGQKRQMRPGADAPRWRKKIFELYLSGDLRKGGRFAGEISLFLGCTLCQP